MLSIAIPEPSVHPAQERAWPTMDQALAAFIPEHPSLPGWAKRRLHLAAHLKDKCDGRLPGDAPAWLRAAFRELDAFLARMARGIAGDLADAEIEAREEIAWITSRERAFYLASRRARELGYGADDDPSAGIEIDESRDWFPGDEFFPSCDGPYPGGAW